MIVPMKKRDISRT